jgi:hypothetical protein
LYQLYTTSNERSVSSLREMAQGMRDMARTTIPAH